MKPIDSLIMLFAVVSQIQKNKVDAEKFRGVRLYETKSMAPISTEEFEKKTLGEILEGLEKGSISFEEITKPAEVKEG